MMKAKQKTNKKRESILDGAIQAFQDEGYDNTSMDRIAEIAKASKRTVYNYFPSKEVLFQAVIDRLMDEISSLKQIPYDQSRSLEDQLSDFAEVKIAMVENPSWLGLTKVTLGVVLRDPQLAQGTIAKAEAEGDALVTWLREAVDDGKLTIEDCELAARVFWSMISGAFFWPILIHGPMDPVIVQVLKKEMIHTFLCRYKP